MNSVLTSIKKLLGIDELYIHFDEDIIIHINTVFSILHQMGVGPENGFTINDKTATWSEYGKIDESIKTYIFLKVKMLFDTPTNSTMVKAIEESISELEWRLYSKSNYDIDE